MKQTLLTISFFLFAKSFACSCAPIKISERNNFLNSNIQHSREILIGDVYGIDTVNHTYKLIVKEVFKGAFKEGEVINGSFKSTCEPYVSIEGTWLLFGHVDANEFVSRDCGYSRSFEFPWYNDFIALKPEPESLTKNELEEFSKESYCELQNKANINLHSDLKSLKKYKTMPNIK